MAAMPRGARWIAAMFTILAAPAPLWAHTRLVRSEPAADATLTVSPTALTLWFSEAPEVAMTRLTLVESQGAVIPLGPVTVAATDPLAVSAAIRSTLPAGRYTVRWRTAAADGHVVHGEFAFTVVRQATAAPAPTPESPASAALDVESPLYVASRWLSFVAMAGMIGVAVWQTVVRLIVQWNGNAPVIAALTDATDGAAGIGAVAAAALLVSLAARLVAQHATMPDVDVGTVLRYTTWGRMWLVQGALTCAALVALVVEWLAAGGQRRWTRSLVVLLVPCLAFTPALAGHAASSGRATGLSIVTDGVHVLGSGAWLGTLAVLLLAGIPAAGRRPPTERGPAVAGLVNAFSPVALTSVGIVAFTGFVTAWLRLGTIRALTGTLYGQVLLVKLAVLSAVILIGAYNWRVVRPALGAADGARRLTRSATAELVIGVLVFAITAVLVATPTPGEM